MAYPPLKRIDKNNSDMRKITTRVKCGLLCACLALFMSCSQVYWTAIDRLSPAGVGWPDEVRRVAVVNNQPTLSDPHVLNFWMIDSRVVADSLAQGLADSRYFTEVVVFDSVLTTMSDPISYDRRQLSQHTVNRLARQLGVDMLVSVEFVGMALADIHPYPFYQGTVYALVKLYKPGGSPQVQTVQESCDMQEFSAYDLWQMAHHEASSLLISHLVPHWTTIDLPYYAGGNVDMRDALVFARRGEWDKVRPLWQRQLDNKKAIRRMEANLNMAVWHEMHDDTIGLARQYALKAQKLAPNVSDSDFISDYIRQMEKRGRDLERVKQQMQRFADDF